MKKVLSLILSGLIIVGLTACTGGKQQTETEAATDSTAVAEQNTETDDPEVKEAEAPKLNAALFGNWSNHADPLVSMVLAEKKGTYDGNKGYGYLTASNEYFETDFTLVFTSITPDGDNIKVHYDMMSQYFNGDPDDYDSPCELVTEKTGEGDLTLIPQDGKVKIDSKESRIKNKVLSKTK